MQEDVMGLKPENMSGQEWLAVLKVVAKGIENNKLMLILSGYGPAEAIPPEDIPAFKLVAEKLTSFSILLINSGIGLIDVQVISGEE